MSRVLAIDYGTKNIGLAISDDAGKVALPYHTIKIKDMDSEMQKLLEDLKNLVKLEAIERIVVGLPLTSGGDRTKLGDQVFAFAKELENYTEVPVEVFDERMTSIMANQLPNKNSRNIHELSAQILLQDYLDKFELKA